ncbi:energy-coupling factor transporter ATPase [Bifidobacterium catulorum]|uniref:Cobalt ABC transporter n=1 Tax=Bifidobacterium catulorum TaxID=1630173 RepID=A0A2U2MSJ6_9BIFI|nr:energy-coupling factor transporter ATPase [Bifidobacterium catulorum]PWG59835.1 cobalt ABC transporter [Bifidobacterium catulorum]
MLRDVRFSYDDGTSWAVDGVDLTIPEGERIAIVGANGSGKSTLGRIIAGLSAPDSGIVTLLGLRVFDGGAHADRYRKARHGIGVVFQNPEDQIVTTVVDDDVAFGPENLGVPSERIGERIETALQCVGMTGHADADPTRMSGGQQQRVAIAGMLAMRPRMIVLDEPTAMLDESGRSEVMAVLDELHAHGTTVVHITHSPDEAMAADRVIVIRDGRIVEDDRPSSDSMPSSRPGPLRQKASSPNAAHPSSAGPLWQRELSDECRGEGVEPPDRATVGRESPSETSPHNRDGSPIITMSHVSFAYDRDHPILRDVSLTVNDGETIAVMGRNGGGKSTLIRLLCALATPDDGDITVAGIPVARRSSGGSRPLRRRDRRGLRGIVGYVMQHPERQLFAETVADDVAYGPRNLGLSGEELDERVDTTLEALGIDHLAGRSPFDLSGGQQRMVAIAGVLACRPRILVMDEPTSSLDADAAGRIRGLIARLGEQGVTVVIVTHDRAEAMSADRVVELCDGVVVPHVPNAPDGRPAIPSTPASPSRKGQSETRRNTERDGTSFVAMLDPRMKMSLTLVLMFTAFAIRTPAQLGIAAVAVGCAMAAARLHPLAVAHSVRLFLGLFAVMSMLNVFFVRSGETLLHLGPIPVTDDGLWTALVYAGRLALVVVLGAVLVLTTTPTRLTDAFEALLAPLQRFGVHTGEIALVMSLALRFMPTLAGETRAIIDAQAARGGSVESGAPLQRIRALTAIIVPVFAGALRHAGNLGLALDARCYEGGEGRTHYRPLRCTWRDVVFAVFSATYLVVLFATPILFVR